MDNFVDVEMSCPECKSLDVRRRYFVPKSIYGHLPIPPVDYCESCGFKSSEPFVEINFRNKRDYKLQQLIKSNELQ